MITNTKACVAYKALWLVGAWCLSANAFAYGVATHDEISSQAAQRSESVERVLSDITVGDFFTPLQDGTTRLTVLDWFRLGANSEDDVPRFVNHFYDPLTGEGLSLVPLAVPSPLWGLEDEREVLTQIYSLREAQEYFYRGLTEPLPREREAFLARTFRTLGHVIHLIQDAAQPQHTRDDSHGVGSLYEAITDEFLSTLEFGGYAAVEFGRARDFWHSRPPNIDPFADISSRKGLAEYSNRGFVSAGTNFRFVGDAVQTDPNYPSPVFDPNSEERVDIRTLDPTTALAGELWFYKNIVVDSNDSSFTDINDRATTLSIFDADLKRFVAPPGSRGLFTLNRFNFFRAHDFLIPRAVSYSTGLLDHLFRGRLEIDLSQTGTQLTVTVTNRSGVMSPLEDGVFELYYDATEGTRKKLGEHQLGGIVLGEGESEIFAIPAPLDIDTDKQKPYTLVFNGLVGFEQGIIGKALQAQPIAEGEFFLTVIERDLLIGGEDRIVRAKTNGALNGFFVDDSMNVAGRECFTLPANHRGLIWAVETDGDHIYVSKWSPAENPIAYSKFEKANGELVYHAAVTFPPEAAGYFDPTGMVVTEDRVIVNGGFCGPPTLPGSGVFVYDNASGAFLGNPITRNGFFLDGTLAADQTRRILYVLDFVFIPGSPVLPVTAFNLDSYQHIGDVVALDGFVDLGVNDLVLRYADGRLIVAVQTSSVNPQNDILVFDATDGSLLGDIDGNANGFVVGGMDVSSTEREIYIVNPNVVEGVITIVVYDLDTLAFKRTISIHGATEGMVDPEVNWISLAN